MIRSLFLFPRTDGVDPAAIDHYVRETLAPFCRAQRGVVSLSMSDGELMGPGGLKPYVKVFEVTHESLEVMLETANAPGAEAALGEFMAGQGLLMAYEVESL